MQKTVKREGKNTCSICKMKAGHNSRSCPKDPRVKKQLAISKIKAPRRKMCSGCKKYGTGHNSLTCHVKNGLNLKGKSKKKVLTRTKPKKKEKEDEEEEEEEENKEEEEEQDEEEEDDEGEEEEEEEEEDKRI
jgi:hypothetical protein